MSDHLTPQQQQETSSRIMHDAELLQNGASTNALGNLVVTGSQYDGLYSQMLKQLADIDSNNQNTSEQLSRVSNVEFSEQNILSFLKDKWIIGAGHSDGRRTPTMNYMRGNFGFGVFYSNRVDPSPKVVQEFHDPNAVGITPTILRQSAAQAGITELVTFSPDSQKRVWMTYETTCDEGSYEYKMSHKDTMRRPGNFLRLKMPLTEDEAISLQRAIQADPELMHRITDTLMLKHFEMSEDEWSKIRPNYDRWRELSADGQNRLAIRRNLNEPVKTNQVVTY